MGNKLWYIAYGSNIMEERFLSYITGAHPSFLKKAQLGALDRTPPEMSRPLTISHQLFFAHSSKAWNNGGVAFIDAISNATAATLARAFLISESQFADVFLQENGRDPRSRDLASTWKKLSANCSMDVCDSWYGKMLRLEDMDGYKCFTFTSPQPISETAAPSELYIQVIAKGIMESHGMSPSEVAAYFYNIAECRLKYSLEQLYQVVLNAPTSLSIHRQ